jgi:hypothetical protein
MTDKVITVLVEYSSRDIVSECECPTPPGIGETWITAVKVNGLGTTTTVRATH